MPQATSNRRETLTSRQRVIRAFNHQPVDRVPIDLGGHTATGISAFAYQNLRDYLGLEPRPAYISDVIQLTPQIDEDVLTRFHCDFVRLIAPWPKTHEWSPSASYRFLLPASARPMRTEDGGWVLKRNGMVLRMPAGGFFFDGGWPSFEDRTRQETLQATAQQAEMIYKESDYATIYRGFSAYVGGGSIDFFCRMLTDTEEVIESNRRQCEQDLKWAGQVIDSLGHYVQAIAFNGDLGTQNEPFVRPELFERVSAPFLRRICSFIHEHSDCKTFLHSCGSIRPLIPILIDCGIDILNPVQISAADMDPKELKREFGDQLVFWGGGCDTQNVLGRGTPAEVRENTRDLVSTFRRGSGYVFNQVHNIMGDVPPENIVAMLDTAYEESFL